MTKTEKNLLDRLEEFELKDHNVEIEKIFLTGYLTGYFGGELKRVLAFSKDGGHIAGLLDEKQEPVGYEFSSKSDWDNQPYEQTKGKIIKEIEGYVKNFKFPANGVVIAERHLRFDSIYRAKNPVKMGENISVNEITVHKPMIYYWTYIKREKSGKK